MNINQDVFPSKYVKAADIKGREVPVVIADARMEKLGDDQKLVVYFQNKEKGLVCNKTNANRIAYLYGPETDGWIGREVVLAVDFVDFQGKTVEAIRIKPPASRPATDRQDRTQPLSRPMENVVTDRGGYVLSESHPAPKDDNLDQDIPF